MFIPESLIEDPDTMCELLGMSANVPTDICFSFSELVRRGGGTGPHRDGWGISFFEGKGCRSFHDPAPSIDSPIADFVCRYPIKSDVVIGHIRHANVGDICLENTQPYIRELWGQYWCFRALHFVSMLSVAPRSKC